MEKPLLIGAKLVGVSPQLLPGLSEFGQKVGLAFQLKDDLLGVFGDTRKTGKSATNDIVEGKWTLLVSFTHERLSTKDRKRLLTILGDNQASNRDILWLKQKIAMTGAKQRVEMLMRQLAEEAMEIVKKLPVKNCADLLQITDFIINRDI